MLIIRLDYGNCITYITVRATVRLVDIAAFYGADSAEILSYKP